MFCRYCGNQLSDQANFCNTCGKKVVEPNNSSSHMLSSKKIKAKKYPLILGLLSLVVFVGIAFFLVKLFNPIKGDSSVIKVDPSTQETLYTYKSLTLRIPGNTVLNQEKLVITPINNLPPLLNELIPITSPIDVTLGEMTEFETPIIIEIPYDKTKLNGIPAKDAFIAVYYNEQLKKWSDIPYEVNEAEGKIRLIMHHLTTIQCYYSTWEGAKVYDDGSSYVIYRNDTSSRSYFSNYETATQRVSDDPTIPQLIVDTAKYAQEIIQAYRDMGLTVPNKPKIYMSLSDSNYNSLTGNISLNISLSGENNPEIKIMRDLAHELYHSAQSGTLGLWTYQQSQKGTINFFAEATADYVACEGLWKELGQTPIGGYKEFSFDYFLTSLFTFDQIHEYASAHFVKFMANNVESISPAKLVEVLGASKDMVNAYDSKLANSNYNTLGFMYESFVEEMLFETPELIEGLPVNRYNTGLELKVKNGTKLELKPNDQGDFENSLIEGASEIQVPMAYSAGFYKFSTDTDTLLELSDIKDSYINGYVVNRTTNKGYSFRTSSSGGNTLSITFSKNDYVLLFCTSSKKEGEKVTFKYKAVPALRNEWSSLKLDVPLVLNNGKMPTADQYYKLLDATLSLGGTDGELTLGWGMIAGSFNDTDGFEYQDFRDNVFKLIKQKDGTYTGSGTLVYTCKSQVSGTYVEESNQTATLFITITPNEDEYTIAIDYQGDTRETTISK